MRATVKKKILANTELVLKMAEEKGISTRNAAIQIAKERVKKAISKRTKN